MKGIKISTLTDVNGQPLYLIVSPANIHDSKLYQPTIRGFKIKIAKGRPITRPTVIVADAAYDTVEIRNQNRKRGIKSNIAINKRNTKKQNPGRPKKFDKEVYKKRSTVERFFSRIESFRKIFPPIRSIRRIISWINTLSMRFNIMESFGMTSFI